MQPEIKGGKKGGGKVNLAFFYHSLINSVMPPQTATAAAASVFNLEMEGGRFHVLVHSRAVVNVIVQPPLSLIQVRSISDESELEPKQAASLSSSSCSGCVLVLGCIASSASGLQIQLRQGLETQLGSGLQIQLRQGLEMQLRLWPADPA